MDQSFDPKKDCCPRFDPAPWDGKIFEWQNKKFISDRVRCLFYIPLNYSGVMARLTKLAAEANVSNPDYLCVSDQVSMSRMDVYYAIDHDIPNVTTKTLSGKFICKVYEGSFSKTGTWMKEFTEYAKQQVHSELKKIYQWYTTCPKCAKKYGKNYVVILGQVS